MPFDRRQEDRETRDMAVAADTKIDNHMEDCVRFRIAIADSLKDMRADLKRINWLLPLMIGGIMAIKEIVDVFVAAHS